MAGIDTSQGRLIFPPRFVPYLEKHRVFELFHELAELLVQERPKDHVTFLRDVLPCAAKRRDKPRIVFLAPPGFDREKFADEIARTLNIHPLTRSFVELKERQRILLERLRAQEALTKPPEEEELSCVCLGEFELGEREMNFKPPSTFFDEDEPPPEMAAPPSPPRVRESVKTVHEEVDPCGGLRVCPCKRTGDEDPKVPTAKEGAHPEGGGPPEEVVKEVVKEVVEMAPNSVCGVLEGSTTLLESSESTTSECICEESEDDIVINFGVLGGCEYSEKGWILVDFPSDAEEAEMLCQQGAIPTHAIRLITGCNEEKDRRYKYLVKEWSTVYKSIPVMDIVVGDRSMLKLAENVGRLLRVMPHRHAPMLPRIVLIGSRGSGATTQAKRLVDKYRVVHVEFQEEMARVVLQDDTFSEMYKRQLMTRPDPELEAAILEKILLAPQCRKRGWVLTGYPTNLDQLRMLDLMATPPNRIIFIEVPARECFIRLYYRITDSTDGTEHKLPVVEPYGVDSMTPSGVDPEVRDRLMRHPRDEKRKIIDDIERYFDEKDEMMRYCGRTASHVNGDKPADVVFELIDHLVMTTPAPAEPPRNPMFNPYGIEDAYETLKKMRMSSGITSNNLMINPPEPIFKL